MTEYRPLITRNGRTQELPAGDTVGGKQLIGFPCTGKPGASEVIGFYVAEVAFIFPANFAGSISRAITSATASSVWNITRIPSGSSTETVIATITFAAGGTLGVFSTQAAVNIGSGDIVRLIGPSTQDSTLSDITFTLTGTR